MHTALAMQQIEVNSHDRHYPHHLHPVVQSQYLTNVPITKEREPLLKESNISSAEAEDNRAMFFN